jgi:hypothetical protein
MAQQIAQARKAPLLHSTFPSRHGLATGPQCRVTQRKNLFAFIPERFALAQAPDTDLSPLK